ncbi:HET-domain-containing protein [Ganoderma leucocontextum]|nr:HET-domain-containing protein [Ganoderma leucocontextum]
MWLLSTDRAELRWFTDASAVPGGYAILSHTWGTQEQTFQEIRAIGERCKAPGKNPRDFVSHKIRKCCLLAEEYGYGWVWVDSCCIDKTSSTELSEAINSMFKWYWQAEVCFAFLADVPSEGGLHGKKSAFRESRWHKRGWTLQELIAPAVVIFLSKDWVRLGTKAELAKLLEEITHVPLPILTRKEYYHQTSVANRMRWAANRQTTRAEDQAYCLMGLFDVSMTVIYGEGTRAFQRLQHKIMKHGFSDMSLFAWGGWLRSDVFRDQGLELALDRDIDPYDDSSYLLAPSPASFLTGFDFTPLHPHPKQSYPPPNLTEEEKAHGAPFNGVEVPTARLDNYGVVCRLPVFEADGVVGAVLLCEDESHQHVGLLLNQDPTSYDPIRPMYYASAVFNMIDNTEQDVPMTYRLVKLGDDLYNLRFNGKAVKARWHTLHIQPRPQAWFSPDTSIARLQLNCGIHPAFRIPHWLIAKFAMLGFQLVSVTGEDELPLRILLSAAPYGEFIHLDLGLCGGDIDNPQSGAHWARVLIHHDQDTSKWNTPHDSHDCNEHHIASWSGGKKLFGDDSNVRGVQLSFAPCTLAAVTDTRTLAVHIELKGSVYADIEYRVEAARDPKLPGDLGPQLTPAIAVSAASSEASGSPWPTTCLLFVFMGAASWPLLAWLIALGTAV